MKIIKAQIHEYVYSHKNEIVEDLKSLIKIPSVRGEADKDAPFGKECARVLEFTEKLYKNNGFETELDKNGGYLLSYYGEGEKALGIFAHADVVPVSDDWIYTNPFEPIEKDGCIIGRGAIDNKSAVVISLYCAKMLKELNIPFNSRLVMFTGGAEESGMDDLKNYLSAHTPPNFSLVADTGFPLYRGNKGALRFTTNTTESLSSGISINGGTGATVIGNATAVLPFSNDLFEELEAAQNERISLNKKDELIEVTAEGIAKHSAIPEGSLNAVAVLMKVLSECKAINEKDRDIFATLYNMADCHYGEYFGIENEDSEFGRLTCVLAKVETLPSGQLKLHFNIRYGITAKKENLINKITEKLKALSYEEPVIIGCSVPHTLEKNNKYVQELLNLYKEFTGNKNAVSYINAGGTYRQYLKNAVETGPTLKWGGIEGMLQGHGGAHQPDEFINIEGLLQAIECTALMLLKLDEKVNESKL